MVFILLAEQSRATASTQPNWMSFWNQRKKSEPQINTDFHRWMGRRTVEPANAILSVFICEHLWLV
jgi:hypothetical protein